MSDVFSPAATGRRRVSRRVRRNRFIAALIPSLLVLSAGGYAAACALAPLPEPVFEVTADLAVTVTAPGDAAQATVAERVFPTAIGWLDGEEVWSNDDRTFPLGSITKLIMMLVAFDYKPLEPGAEGDTYIWTAEDAARTADYIAVDGVAYNIPVGTRLTQRDMMKFIFLPSANDVAHTYALWTFGSNEAFLEALETWKAEHGIESINLVEPTGMELEDQATAADLVRVARLALKNPTITEFNGMQYADMPWGIGTIENSNPLLGVMPNILGTKTGTIYSSYNLVASQRIDVDGREAVSISVTLARPSPSDRAVSGRNMLTEMSALSQAFTVVEEGTPVGTLRGVDGQTVEFTAGESASVTLLPGESATRTVDVTPDGGVITVDTPAGSTEVSLTTTGTLTEPGFWWRIKNPGALF